MDPRYVPHLAWVDAQQGRMSRLIAEWARVNSGSHNVEGLRQCTELVLGEFAGLGGEVRLVDLPSQPWVGPDGNVAPRPLGRLVHIARRPAAGLRVLLGIHIDTVYGPDDPFRDVTAAGPDTLVGPGVADAKGGLAVMLVALEALGRSPFAGRVGWDLFINPDEEVGSPGSGPLLADLAKRCSLGLLFEPSLPDGSLVGARKGSGQFAAVVTGRAAHAGRDFHRGRNAVHALAEFVTGVAGLNGASPGIVANVGRVAGGGAANVVPDRAVCHFNLRADSADEQRLAEAHLARLAEAVNARDGLTLTLHGSFASPPKPLDDATRRLLDYAAACGRDLGLSVGWRDSGGACDGNRLAAAGLPTLDSLGPTGGELHSPREYLSLPSLAERAKMTTLLLMKLATGECPWPG